MKLARSCKLRAVSGQATVVEASRSNRVCALADGTSTFRRARLLVARRPGDDDDEFVSDRPGGLRLLQGCERRSEVLLVIVCHRDRMEKVEKDASNLRRWKLT
jgi:hypothetical protein